MPRSGALAFFVGKGSVEASVLFLDKPGEKETPAPKTLAPRDATEFPFLIADRKATTLPFQPVKFVPLEVEAYAEYEEREKAFQKAAQTADPIKNQMFGFEREIQGGGFSPRYENHLLLQVTGENAGLANFWISPDALKRRQFDQTFVTYDND